MKQYAVMRAPTSGPKALITPPNDFGSLADAEARIAEIESTQTKSHHTHLEVFHYSGDVYPALQRAGVIF